MSKDVEIIKLLIENGADFNIVNVNLKKKILIYFYLFISERIPDKHLFISAVGKVFF